MDARQEHLGMTNFRSGISINANPSEPIKHMLYQAHFATIRTLRQNKELKIQYDYQKLCG